VGNFVGSMRSRWHRFRVLDVIEDGVDHFCEGY
jgi:hypothetical protein